MNVDCWRSSQSMGIKALTRKPEVEESRKIVERIMKQVQPIMRKRKWRVKLPSEFCPKNASLLGLNVGGGVHVKLRLHRPNRDLDFYPFDQVLDTMLHELCHNAHGPLNANFYKLWDELRKECEELMSKGITGVQERVLIFPASVHLDQNVLVVTAPLWLISVQYKLQQWPQKGDYKTISGVVLRLLGMEEVTLISWKTLYTQEKLRDI